MEKEDIVVIICLFIIFIVVDGLFLCAFSFGCPPRTATESERAHRLHNSLFKRLAAIVSFLNILFVYGRLGTLYPITF